MTSAAGLDLGRQFKSREARDHFADVLDQAQEGVAVVTRAPRNGRFVVLLRETLDDLLRELAPLDVRSAISGHDVAFWIEGVPVHAAAASLDEAEEQFLDALLDYAELWFSELRSAPNHRRHKPLVMRVAIFAGDRDALRAAVFGRDD